MRLTATASALCLGLLLTSCADLPKQSPNNPAWRDRVTQLSALKQWSASGKIAIRTEQQSQSANLEWQQSEHITQIILSGPIGLGATSIESDRQTLKVNHNGQTQTYDISSRTDSVGWDLPLQALPFWVLGLPAPDSPVQEKIIEQNLMRELHQLGWTIHYQSYGLFEHHSLPTKMQIERDGTRARLILRHWSGFSN